MDRERADFTRAMESLTSAFGRTVVPVQLPIGSEKSFSGVVDLVKMKAYTYEMGGNGKSKVGEIREHCEEAKAASTSGWSNSWLRKAMLSMEEFFDKGDDRRGAHHRRPAQRHSRQEDIFPVLFASGLVHSGHRASTPSSTTSTAVERGTVKAAATANNGAARKAQSERHRTAFAFRSSRPISDPFGRISFFKVYSAY